MGSEDLSTLKPFRTDGCSMWPDGEVRSCCVDHDKIYWRGGTWRQRLAADNKLFFCASRKVARRYNSLAAGICWGAMMWIGVRFGGTPFLPLPWRWGYGHRWPRWKFSQGVTHNG